MLCGTHKLTIAATDLPRLHSYTDSSEKVDRGNFLNSGPVSEAENGEHPGDHNHQDFPRSAAIQMGGVLQYKREACCDTNGRRGDGISLSSERRDTKSTAIHIGGVLQYKLEAHRNTNWKRIGIPLWNQSTGGWGF